MSYRRKLPDVEDAQLSEFGIQNELRRHRFLLVQWENKLKACEDYDTLGRNHCQRMIEKFSRTILILRMKTPVAEYTRTVVGPGTKFFYALHTAEEEKK